MPQVCCLAAVRLLFSSLFVLARIQRPQSSSTEVCSVTTVCRDLTSLPVSSPALPLQLLFAAPTTAQVLGWVVAKDQQPCASACGTSYCDATRMSAVKDSDTFYFIRDTWTEVCGADLNIRKVMVWGNGATPFIYYSPDNNNRIVYVGAGHASSCTAMYTPPVAAASNDEVLRLCCCTNGPQTPANAAISCPLNSIETGTTPIVETVSCVAATDAPTAVPTASPTPLVPTSKPTATPTAEPSSAPTAVPSTVPSAAPTHVPSGTPTAGPSAAPTLAPSRSPSVAPSAIPTAAPSVAPTAGPSGAPTAGPTAAPTASPTTAGPTQLPTQAPTNIPSFAPTFQPSLSPTHAPSNAPSRAPTAAPSTSPTTSRPTSLPSAAPSNGPTSAPSSAPTSAPTLRCTEPFKLSSPAASDPPYNGGDTLSVRFETNASCTVEFVTAKICVFDPLVHASGTVGDCFTLGERMAYRNDGEIDCTIGAAIAKGEGFYRVHIADTDDVNLHVLSGLIELVSVVAEGLTPPVASLSTHPSTTPTHAPTRNATEDELERIRRQRQLDAAVPTEDEDVSTKSILRLLGIIFGASAGGICATGVAVAMTALLLWFAFVKKQGSMLEKAALGMLDTPCTSADHDDVELGAGIMMITTPMCSAVKIEVAAFWARDKTKESAIVVPSGVKSIPKNAFKDCGLLTSIEFPESLITIEESAFSGCSSLIFALLPESVTSIGDSAFRGCSSLTYVCVPDAVASIGESAFVGCSSLEVTNISARAVVGADAFPATAIVTKRTPVALKSAPEVESLSIVIPKKEKKPSIESNKTLSLWQSMLRSPQTTPGNSPSPKKWFSLSPKSPINSDDSDIAGGRYTTKMREAARRIVEQRAEAKGMFQSADSDGSGVLDRAEFCTAHRLVTGVKLPIEEVRDIHDRIDTSGDGLISFDEFYEWAKFSMKRKQSPSAFTSAKTKMRKTARRIVEQRAEAKGMFQSADSDGSGVLDRAEFRTAHRLVTGVKLPIEDVRDIHDRIDTSGDGLISFDEFYEWAKFSMKRKQSPRTFTSTKMRRRQRATPCDLEAAAYAVDKINSSSVVWTIVSFVETAGVPVVDIKAVARRFASDGFDNLESLRHLTGAHHFEYYSLAARASACEMVRRKLVDAHVELLRASLRSDELRAADAAEEGATSPHTTIHVLFPGRTRKRRGKVRSVVIPHCTTDSVGDFAEFHVRAASGIAPKWLTIILPPQSRRQTTCSIAAPELLFETVVGAYAGLKDAPQGEDWLLRNGNWLFDSRQVCALVRAPLVERVGTLSFASQQWDGPSGKLKVPVITL